MAGEAWKSLSDEDKTPYNIKAQEDKDRYMREVNKNSAPNQARS